jgi:LmbE family N-acetylglucosaminyl deacetylase
MHTPDNDTLRDSLPGIRRLIPAWEYRHFRAFAAARFTAGGFLVGIGVVLLSLGKNAETDQERRKCYTWAASLMGISVLHFLGGYLDITGPRSAPPPT